MKSVNGLLISLETLEAWYQYMNKNIPLFGVVTLPEMEAVAIDVLRSGQIASGEYVGRFERALGGIVGCEHVVSTVDMTSAMFLALHLSGVRKGDEVLTTAFACLSTNSAIAQIGATPIWVDLAEHSLHIDLSDLGRKISHKTKAVILYHVAGYPSPTKEVAALCHARGISLIEDCDNALFAKKENVPVGADGDFSVYSFYPNRQINASEGGALICKNQEHAAQARKLRRFGIDSSVFRCALGEIDPAVDIPEIGWAFTMNNLCAALGYSQIATAESRVNQSRANVDKLSNEIKCIGSGVRLVSVSENDQPAFWVLLLFVLHRDKVLASMKKQGVHVSRLHQRNDIYSGFQANSPTELPNTSYLQEHILALPCGWWLSDDDLSQIVDALKISISISGPSL
jgi:dTDP-4-amino-4,6-dideoxygalactose transaminase